jgi:hypothetical protein
VWVEFARAITIPFHWKEPRSWQNLSTALQRVQRHRIEDLELGCFVSDEFCHVLKYLFNFKQQVTEARGPPSGDLEYPNQSVWLND